MPPGQAVPPGPPLPQGPPPGYAGPPGPQFPSQPPFGGPQPPFRPYGPPYGAGRRRSKKPLVIIPLVVVLLVGLISVIVYLQTEPKRFLEAWAAELGEPQGMSLYNGGWIDNDRNSYYALWRAVCIKPGDCSNPSPFESVSQWLGRAGNRLGEPEVRECYLKELNCQETIVKDGHKGVISLDQSSVEGNQFDMEVELYW